jgi:hypothetical protein
MEFEVKVIKLILVTLAFQKHCPVESILESVLLEHFSRLHRLAIHVEVGDRQSGAGETKRYR